MVRRNLALSVGAVAAALLLSGCVGVIPADPNGTLDRVTDGTLRVGVSHNPPWAETRSEGDPTGTEVSLVEEFAGELDADVEWTEGSEAPLVDALERGELDLVIAGFLDATPWTDKAATTAVYTESVDPQGRTQGHVMLTPMGENAFLVTLERFLRDAAD